MISSQDGLLLIIGVFGLFLIGCLLSIFIHVKAKKQLANGNFIQCGLYELVSIGTLIIFVSMGCKLAEYPF